MSMMDEISKKKQPHHNTIYCNPRHKQRLLREAKGPTIRGADDLKISGMRIVVHEWFEYPILCKKGQLFNLARDFKYGQSWRD